MVLYAVWCESNLFTGQPEDALHPSDSQSHLDVVGHPEWDLLWHSQAFPWQHTHTLILCTQENEQVTHYMENRYCPTLAAKNNPSAGFPPTSQCVTKSFESDHIMGEEKSFIISAQNRLTSCGEHCVSGVHLCPFASITCSTIVFYLLINVVLNYSL